jgi:hypothetical protein
MKGRNQLNEMKYALLTEVIGRWKADILENFLKAEEIDVVIVQETLTDLFTSTFSPVKIYVPNEDIDRAHELLKTFEEPQAD